MQKKLNFLGVFVVLFVFSSSNATQTVTKKSFFDYLVKMESISGKTISKKQKAMLNKVDVRETQFRNPSFISSNQKLYKIRLAYKDYSRDSLIEEWKSNCSDMYWPAEDIVHHIIPRGYGGQNVWWNIFPLTFRAHREAGVGIHSSNEFKTVFPLGK